MACYNFDTYEHILIFFGRNVADKVGNQICFNMPSQITCASALLGKLENTKITFSRERCIVESTAAVALCCMHSAPVRCLPKRKIDFCYFKT